MRSSGAELPSSKLKALRAFSSMKGGEAMAELDALAIFALVSPRGQADPRGPRRGRIPIALISKRATGPARMLCAAARARSHDKDIHQDVKPFTPSCVTP